MIWIARLNCRRPFSASRRAISIGSLSNWATSAWLWRSSAKRPASLRFGFDLPIRFGNHLARNSLVLDVGIAVGKALTLLSELVGRHRDLAGADDQFL